MNEFINKFITISNQGWIKGKHSGYGDIGLTFENLIGKRADSKYLPDYNGIEIKCTTRYSNFPIGLFSIAFENRYNDRVEINRIIENYGYFDRNSNKKIIYSDFSCREISPLTKSGFKFVFDYSALRKKIILNVFDRNNNLIDNDAYINLGSIRNRVDCKLKTLAIVKASKKKMDNDLYYRYYELKIYKLKSTNQFLKLLKYGTITTKLVARYKNTGKYAGKSANKNIMFFIRKEDIDKLFDLIYVYNHDDPSLNYNINNYI